VGGADGQLIGFPRHLSQHPGGFVIARDDLARLVPVENAAMDDRSVIQWDKDDLDALGLLKVDVLALGMLSAIQRALAWWGPNWATRWNCTRSRPKTSQLRDAVPRRQRGHLPGRKPRPDEHAAAPAAALFYDLVIEVAIVRPGPIQGGMVHPYLRRRSGEEPVDYPSDEVRQALERTLGVPIFQEQVMQLAILAADFTPGEADQLRRAMAAWKRKGGLGPFHERLVGRMVAKGYELDYAERIFKQIQGFGEYGFPESHAASFALLVYASAWLKCHHPDAFLAALLNSQPMGFYAPAQLVRDAREHGVQVRPVDVNRSLWDTLEEGRRGAAFRCAWASAASAAWPQTTPAERIVAARWRRSPLRQRRRPGPPRRAGRPAAASCWPRPMRCAPHRPPPPGRLGGGRRRHPRHAAAAPHPHARGARRTARARRRHHRAGRLPQPPACRSHHHPLALLRQDWPPSRCSPPPCCALAPRPAWRGPAASSRTASGPRRPRAWSS
jgi:error-prone DNA polymerase